MNNNAFDTSSINGGLALDEEFYQLWLRNPTSNVIHLVEIDYVGSNAGTPTIYTLNLSTNPFPPYKNVVMSIPSFSRQIGDTFTGAVTASYGEMSLDNTDGTLDTWLTLNISGQKVRIFQGDPTWPRERFRLVNECLAEIVSSAGWDKIVIRLRAQDFGSNLPIQTNLIPTTTTQTVANVVVPKAFGTVFNIDPAVVDATNQVYQWNDGATTSVTDARDGGVSFKTNQIVVSAVSGNTQTTPTAHGFVAGTRVRSDVGSLPIVASWSSMAWNGTVFCAVGYGSNSACISADGIRWITVPLPSSSNWISVVWNGTVFCAVAYNSNQAATSPDGITWASQTLPSSTFWRTLAWNGSVFCTIASGTSIAATSPDGITWTTSAMASVGSWNALTWNGTVFCTTSSGSAVAATSPDGITWTNRVLPIADTWLSMAWNGTVFCAVAQSSTNAAISPDGITWTLRTLPSADMWNSIFWNGSVFCSIASGSPSRSITSPDGVTWSSVFMPVNDNWDVICWNGTVFCTIAQSANTSSISVNGVSWTAVSSTPPTPLSLSTDYWVVPTGLTSTTFQVSLTRGGLPITLTSATTGGAWVGYHWTADNTTGKLYLDSKPAGKLTMDGVAPNGTATTALAATLSAINVDTTSKLVFNAKCPQNIGIYIKDRRNRIDVAADIINAVNGWYGAGRSGMLKFGRVESINAISTANITKEDMIFQSLVLEKMIMPRKGHRVGYAKNYTVQTSGLFAGCSTDNVAYYNAAEKVAVGKAATLLGADDVANNLLAVIPDVDSSLLVLASDAAAEGYRLNEMYKGYSAIFACEVGLIGTEIDIGDVVNVTFNRYGLNSGVNMTVVYIEDKPDTSTVALKFFAYLGTYAPGQL